jgi:eukaryotic-like serine/threonine-protein kinase
LLTRRATLMANVGFALTSLGARDESRKAIEQGLELAERLGATGVSRHCKMVLLCWSATFGRSPDHDAVLRDVRKVADDAATGSWAAHDRATLGILFYRALEHVRAADPRSGALLKLATQGYRTTNMLDVIPVALAHLSASELSRNNNERSLALAREAAALLDGGSLLNEAPIFLALHHAASASGQPDEAEAALHRGVPLVEKRALALQGTDYLQSFRELSDNAELLRLAEAVGCAMPVSLRYV